MSQLPIDLKLAHKHCIFHKREIEKSSILGCFYCLEQFSVATIEEWVDSAMTALCPKCGIDAVIGDASGLPVGDVEFLKTMNERWFGSHRIELKI